jgi:hypothetical protein
MSNGAATLESLHDDIAALRSELTTTRHELRLDLVRLEAKIDSKPSLMAMFTGIVVVVLGLAGVVFSTIATLHTLGFIK